MNRLIKLAKQHQKVVKVYLNFHNKNNSATESYNKKNAPEKKHEAKTV